jgi:hypothetical protein
MIVSFNIAAMRNAIAIGCICLLTPSCLRKAPPVDVPTKLKTTWLSFLEKPPKFDSSHVRFDVKDVVFFRDSTVDTAYYLCEFKVRMRIPDKGIDTTGTMNATISKDFTIVHRKY